MDKVPILAFLELMNDITPNMLDDDKKERIAEYIGANYISKKDILKYASQFP